MEKLELFRAIGELDDDILEDAEEFLAQTPGRARASAWVKWGSLAACAAVAVCAAWFAARTPVARPAVLPDPLASEELLPSALQSAAPSMEQGEPTVDAPAVESEALTRPVVQMNFNELDGAPPQDTAALFALMAEDFVPMTRSELLDYYGVTLPIEALFPDLSATGPEEGDGFGRGIYRRGERGAYFDTNTFAFESGDGGLGVYVTLDKAFHMLLSPWELPGDGLRFTEINGWELALFYYVDEDGNGCYYTEFTQNGVNYRVIAKNRCEQEYAAVLEALLEPREDFAPGAVRTVTGTCTVGLSRQTLTETQPDGSTKTEVSCRGPLGLTLEDGSSLRVELTPEQAESFYGSLSLGDRVTVRFTGEPATVGTVWKQQLVSIERE